MTVITIWYSNIKPWGKNMVSKQVKRRASINIQGVPEQSNFFRLISSIIFLHMYRSLEFHPPPPPQRKTHPEHIPLRSPMPCRDTPAHFKCHKNTAHKILLRCLNTKWEPKRVISKRRIWLLSFCFVFYLTENHVDVNVVSVGVER